MRSCTNIGGKISQIYQEPFSRHTDVGRSWCKYRTQMQGKYWNWNRIIKTSCVSFLPSGLSPIFRAGDFGVSSRNIPVLFVGEVVLRRDEIKRSIKFINNSIQQVRLGLYGIYCSASTVHIHLHGVDNEQIFFYKLLSKL